MISRLIKLFISTLVWIYDSVRSWFYFLVRSKPVGSCVVLYYHAIFPEQRDRFSHQMDDLVRIAQPVSGSEMESLEKGISYVVVTFDDGFRCIVENAFPELIVRNIPCTVFVPSGCLGKTPSWIQENNGDKNQEVVMDENEVKALKKTGLISIGSHTVSHTRLTSLGEEEARHEILRSKETLEALIGEEIQFLSFPYGAFNEKHIEMARQGGYKRVFSITPVCAFIDSGEYVTGRVRVDPTDWRFEFRLKVRGAYRWLPLAFLLKSKMHFS